MQSAFFLSDINSQVNPLLAPKLTEYAKMTEEQKQRKRGKRRIRDQKQKIELKRKTEDSEALGRVQKARKELEREVTDLKSVVTTMQQPVRGSVQYYEHEIAALKVKRAEDANKIEEADKKAKNQAEAHKEQIKQLEDNFKKQTAAIKAQIRTAKTKHRQAQEEIVVKQEQHRTTLAAVTQDNADFYEDEVAQLNASLEVADLETKIMVDGKATREWDIDYWVGQMKSMMHTTPAVTLKLWDYAMNYVEATSAVKRSKDWSPPTRKHLAELRTDAGLVGQICAGVTVAKAKSLLCVMIDETELECSSMQSMIAKYGPQPPSTGGWTGRSGNRGTEWFFPARRGAVTVQQVGTTSYQKVDEAQAAPHAQAPRRVG